MSASVNAVAGGVVGGVVVTGCEPPPHPAIPSTAVAPAAAPAPTTKLRRDTGRLISSFNFSTRVSLLSLRGSTERRKANRLPHPITHTTLSTVATPNRIVSKVFIFLF